MLLEGGYSPIKVTGVLVVHFRGSNWLLPDSLKMICFIRVKIYDNTFKKSLRRKCSKVIFIACVAGAKRGGGGGREKRKREGSACSKSLCYCITPTNFLVIRLRLLSIKCRYTHHCRKTLHSRTKEIRLVIQIQKALWRKLEPLFSRNKKGFTLQKRSKKLSLHQRANPADQTTVNRYVCHDLSVWNIRLK